MLRSVLSFDFTPPGNFRVAICAVLLAPPGCPLLLNGQSGASPIAKVPNVELLISDLHSEAANLAPRNTVDVLCQLSIAATGVSRKLSAAWAREMYDLATTQLPTAGTSQLMNRAATRKNALTVLSFSDPESAAGLFLQLEPSLGHAPFEDPRVDLSRHLFPRLWTQQGRRALPQIRLLARFTAESGEYPYVAMGHLLPLVAKVDQSAARDIFSEAVNAFPGTHGLHRTLDAYVRFLRSAWPVGSLTQKREAVRVGVTGTERAAREWEASMGGRTLAEYYLPNETVRLHSEVEARLYDLLPFVDEVDQELGRSIRERYPRLQNVSVPGVGTVPWRSGVFASPGRDTPELIGRAFEWSHVRFLAQWAAEDAPRAANIALRARDSVFRGLELAIILPEYAKAHPAQAESWRANLQKTADSEADQDLDFLVALIRADFALAHKEEAHSLARKFFESALKRGNEALPALEELEDICGQYWFGDPDWFHNTNAISDSPMRLLLLARYARGALRNRAAYEEPD